MVNTIVITFGIQLLGAGEANDNAAGPRQAMLLVPGAGKC
jgi:hypothetical protein